VGQYRQGNATVLELLAAMQIARLAGVGARCAKCEVWEYVTDMSAQKPSSQFIWCDLYITSSRAALVRGMARK
jgi:hypothetical protein